MMMSEFIDRTGFEPTAKEYAKIEEAYPLPQRERVPSSSAR